MYAFHIPRHMTKWRGKFPGTISLTRALSTTSLSRPLVKRFDSRSATAVLQLDGFGSRSLQQSASGLVSVRNYNTESFTSFAENNPILLRDTCKCTQCVDPSTHQRDFKYADIPLDISVNSIQSDSESGTWKVTWNNDIPGYVDHVSVFPQPSLTQLLDGMPASLGVERTLSLWDKTKFAEETRDIDFSDLMDDEHTLTTTLELIQRHGLVFVSNVPKDETAVMKMVTRLTGLYRNTFYGQSWDVQSVPQAKNVAYTSKYLGFHMDLLYMREPPGLQLLHCLQNSCQGGESEFADTFKAVDVLKQEQPKLVDMLVDSKIRYGYSNDGYFYSDDKPVIKVGNEKHRPALRIQNAVHPDFMGTVDCIYWSPPFINSIAGAACNGSIKEFIEASKAFAEVLQRPEMIFESKLSEGTCAVFDNLRVVHARKEFDVNSGKRWLKGIYGDRQDILSKSLKHVWNV